MIDRRTSRRIFVPKNVPKAFVVLSLMSHVSAQFLQNDSGKRIRIAGDLILGGIFPMHEQRNGKCGAVKEEKGIQRLEAMLYAMDKINRDPTILPNVTLGALILDSCSSDTYALEQSMEFVKSYMSQDMSEYRCESGRRPTHVPHKPVIGVIGASFSVVSIMVANILRLFKIPQLSYASTSTELSDKSRFEYFSRVVPPDNFQAQAIVEVVKVLGWKYVSTVAVEGDYGEKGIASFISLATNSGICMAVSEKILRNSKQEDFDRIVERLLTKPHARGVVMFVDEDNTRQGGKVFMNTESTAPIVPQLKPHPLVKETTKLLQSTIRANKTGHFMWIGSDSWGAKNYPVRDQESAAEGAITILPRRTALVEFDEYFTSLRPRMNGKCNESTGKNINIAGTDAWINCRNVWFREFWSQHHKCYFDTGGVLDLPPEINKPCTGEEKLQNYEEEGLVPFVVDAVYAMAHAAHDILKDECGDPGLLCDKMKPTPPGSKLLKYIRNVSFVGLQGTDVRFNDDGDAFGSYSIFQYQKGEEERYDYIMVGSWKEKLHFEMSKTKWRTENSSIPPKSICSEPCPLGHIRNFQDQCCWSCVSCRDDAYVYNDSCLSCKPGWAPNENKTDCYKLKAEVIPWHSPWAIVPLVFSAIGILVTLFTLFVFVKYNNTPIIMASGRELCYVLLSGILSCYLMSFVILAEPSTVTCTTLRIGLGLCLSICYSAIFTKTNRISRIFNRGIKSIKRPSYTSPRSQVVISLGIVSIQLIGTIVWLVIEKPDTKEIYPYPLTAVSTCAVSTFSLMMSLVYNMVLIILCTLYAFKTRKIPENFNEAKYIGFTMYSTCIVWLAFVPIYFGTNNDYKIQIASMCMCINISATVALGCLFTPKVYIVMFQPNKNVRQSNAPNSGAGRAAYSMKFTGCRSQTAHSVQSVTSGSRSSPRSSHHAANGETNCGPGGEELNLS